MGGGGKSKGSRAAQQGKGGKTWVEVARERFDARGGRDSGKGKGDVPEELTKYVAAAVRDLDRPPPSNRGVFAAPPEETSEEEAVEPVATASSSSVYRAALETHRMSSGRRASGFEPQRNTFYVLGRPIQVCKTTKTSFMSVSVWGFRAVRSCGGVANAHCNP